MNEDIETILKNCNDKIFLKSLACMQGIIKIMGGDPLQKMDLKIFTYYPLYQKNITIIGFSK